MSYETKNTRLAAALLAMEFRMEEGLLFGAVTTFKFSDGIFRGMHCEEFGHTWIDNRWPAKHPDHPFTFIRKAAEARDWIVSRVVHGKHNLDMPPPVTGTFKTRNLNLASCLVADGFYLLRLDTATREFHFPHIAEKFRERYKSPEPDGAIFWQLKYLHKFNWLHRCIRAQQFVPDPIEINTRQDRNQCVVCHQS